MASNKQQEDLKQKQDTQQPQKADKDVKKCDICGDPVYSDEHAVHFSATQSPSQTVCESCVEELWSEVKGMSETETR